MPKLRASHPITADSIEKAIIEAFKVLFSKHANLLQQKDKT